MEALLSTHADRRGVDISVTVCFLFVFTVTDFTTADKVSSGHIFLGGPSASKAGNLTFWGTLLPRSPKSDELASAWAMHTRM